MDVSRFCNDKEQLNDKRGWTRVQCSICVTFFDGVLMPVVSAVQGLLHTQKISTFLRA